MFSCIQQRAYVSSVLKRNQKKSEKKKKKKRKEKGKKKMTRVRRNFHHVKVTVTAWRVTSTCRKCLCQAVNKIGFFRAGEGPKYTQGKQVAVLSI
jgi:hypothetical protein